MFKIRYINLFLLGLLCSVLSSCETSYADNNGVLGGMWQLESWNVTDEEGDTSVKATKEDGIYYSIQREFIQFSQTTKDNNNYYRRMFGRMSCSAGKMVITNILTAKNEPATLDDVSQYGVPADGVFVIESLSKERLVLSYKNNKLCFRKY